MFSEVSTMEEILLNRLSKFASEVKSLSDQALNLCNILHNDENIETARIVTSKLKTMLSRFTSELYNYFKICNDPNQDEISDMTTYQLQGEENLAELEARLTMKTERPATLPKQSDHTSYSKLPDLCLPEFSGNLLEWHQFWDQFTSNMNRRKLNDVDKLLYLKSSLKGDAARLVDGFDTTNKSYQIAVDTLKARYGKENEIIYAHHNALKRVKRAEKMEDCKGVLDDIERHLRVLQAMGENTNSNQTRFLIMEKFPTDIVYETKMRIDADKQESVEEILKQLSRVISVKEEARIITQESNTNNAAQYTVETLHIKENSQKNNWKTNSLNNIKHKEQWNNFTPKPNNSNSRRPIKRKFEPKRKQENVRVGEEKRSKLSCIFCKENHTSENCQKPLREKKANLGRKCFMCFRDGHIARKCFSKKICKYCGRYGWHNSALCPKNFKIKEKKEKTSTSVKENDSTSTSVMHMQTSRKGSTVLQTAVVKVKGHGGTTQMCRILLDCGSQRSYITQRMARELNLQTEEQNNLAIFTFGSQRPQEILSPLVKVDLMTQNKSSKTLFVNTVPCISQGVPHPGKELLHGKFSERYRLADDGSLADRVDILLGNDYYFTVMSTKKICIEEDLYLVQSEFGWILSGKMPNESFQQMSVLTYFQSSFEVGLNQPDPPLDNGGIKHLWDLESIGIIDSPKINRDEEAIKHFNETTELKDKRYYVCWPWNDHPSKLPSNFGLAFGRLVNLLKRLDTDTLMSYDQTLRDQLEKGVIEEVPSVKDSGETHPIHYIPHHGVSVPEKPLRIVYDASAKTKDNKSLNEHLYRGPILLEDLTGLIIKFRCHSLGLTADIEKAFLQIGLKEQDRDVTRFLWIRDIRKPAKENNLIHLRFTRVPFGIISSPFMLNATVKHHLAKAEDERVQELAKEIYVDNVVTGCNSIEEALDLYRNSKETFQQISMNLRQWSSNSKNFMERIPDACPDKLVKILGLNWNLEDDTLHLRTKITRGANTKRGVLKVIASVYDPCGYAVPHVLSAKLFLQDLWKDKAKWDSPLSKELVDEWIDICNELNDVNEISVNRCYMPIEESKEYQLHCFTDASQKAYAASIFLVNGTQKTFVMGKSRLVPIKDRESFTIPRLELLGVLIGSRLMKYVLRFLSHKISRQILWTDSQIVIEWCKTDKLLPPFVTRRIEEIKKNQTLEIRYVPTALNPADVGTRPSSSREEKDKWLVGPQFLVENPDTWPCKIATTETSAFSTGEGLSKTDSSHDKSSDSEVINPDGNCSNECESETQSKGIDNLIQEAAEIDTSIKSKIQDVTDMHTEPRLEDNTLNEVKKVQAEHFEEELNGKETSLYRNLGLFKDIDGILRCKGRLKYAEWSFDKRYPILIPKDCDFTNKVITNTHENNYHVGVNHTLSLIRHTYWIPQGKRQVRKILQKCPRCVKHGGGPFKLPPTPALPHERVNYSKPFTFTGIDYLGPVLVKTEKGTSKRWICLFTCLAVRALHLEIVEDLSAEEGLLALRRMIATRGVPNLITSDNALHFKLISDIVSNAYCVENKIKWRFIPELAPWFGGFYERLVGLVKHCMRRTFQKHLLNDSQLSTMIKEIEAVINTRPLTSVDSELEHILTPSDFLQTGRCVTMETSNEDAIIQGTSTKTNLIKGWKRARMILDEFKEMFCNHYLPSLRERYNHSHKQPRVISHLTPKEGQIVQIKGDKNREGWKVGKIISLVKGSDDQVRVAQVKVGNAVFTRSIAHLYPLEVDDHEQKNPIAQDSTKYIRELPSKIPEALEIIPDIIMEGSDEVQKETIAESETESVEVRDMPDVTVDVTAKKQEKPETDVAESTDKVDDELRNDLNTMDTDEIVGHDEEKQGQSEEVKIKRGAAVRALEKIREWTRNLMITLL